MNGPDAKLPFLGLPLWLRLLIPVGIFAFFTYFIGILAGYAAVVIVLAAIGWWIEHRDRKAQEAEDKKRAHEAWLRSPEGIAFQAAEREEQRKHQQEADRRRKEAERQRDVAEEAAARANWRTHHESKSMVEIAKMTGRQFEEFLARLFSKMGYTEVSLTATNDQGGDLLCLSPDRTPVVIQAKRWKGTVGNSAVQELLGAMLHYGRDKGMVVTNSRFTQPARELAQKDSRITLLDGRWLAEQIKKFLPPEIPEFSWGEYRKLAANFRYIEATHLCPACHSPMRSIKSRFGRGYFFGCTKYPNCKGTRHESDPGPSRLERQRQELERQKREAEAAEQQSREAARRQAENVRVAAEAAQQEAEQRDRAERERVRQEVERLRQERAKRMERWQQSGMPREWVLEHPEGWDQPALTALFNRVKATAFWPLDSTEMIAHLEALRNELRVERDRKLGKQEDAAASAQGLPIPIEELWLAIARVLSPESGSPSNTREFIATLHDANTGSHPSKSTEESLTLPPRPRPQRTGPPHRSSSTEESLTLPPTWSGGGSPYYIREDTSPWQDNAIRAMEGD